MRRHAAGNKEKRVEGLLAVVGKGDSKERRRKERTDRRLCDGQRLCLRRWQAPGEEPCRDRGEGREIKEEKGDCDDDGVK